MKGLVEIYIKDKINSFASDFMNLSTKDAKNKSSVIKHRIYKDILNSKFKLVNLVRIEHIDDYSESISGKAEDFAYNTIKDQ